MPIRVAKNVSLTPDHAAFIASLVSSGRYGGVSKVARPALRVFEELETDRAISTSATAEVSKP